MSIYCFFAKPDTSLITSSGNVRIAFRSLRDVNITKQIHPTKKGPNNSDIKIDTSAKTLLILIVDRIWGWFFSPFYFATICILICFIRLEVFDEVLAPPPCCATYFYMFSEWSFFPCIGCVLLGYLVRALLVARPELTEAENRTPKVKAKSSSSSSSSRSISNSNTNPHTKDVHVYTSTVWDSHDLLTHMFALVCVWFFIYYALTEPRFQYLLLYYIGLNIVVYDADMKQYNYNLIDGKSADDVKKMRRKDFIDHSRSNFGSNHIEVR